MQCHSRHVPCGSLCQVPAIHLRAWAAQHAAMYPGFAASGLANLVSLQAELPPGTTHVSAPVNHIRCVKEYTDHGGHGTVGQGPAGACLMRWWPLECYNKLPFAD